jgi:hypothetical protein
LPTEGDVQLLLQRLFDTAAWSEPPEPSRDPLARFIKAASNFLLLGLS